MKARMQRAMDPSRKPMAAQHHQYSVGKPLQQGEVAANELEHL